MRNRPAALPALIVACLLLLVAAGGCSANARSQLAAANQAKDALNRSLIAAIKSGVYDPPPAQAAAVKGASVAVAAALDAAAAHLLPDGSADDAFAASMDAAAAALDRFRAALAAAGVPHD